MDVDKPISHTSQHFSGPVFHLIEKSGLLVLSGESQRAYLQRQTSNNLDLLDANSAIPNILPNAKGRVLDVFINILWGEGIALITPPQRAPGLKAYFEKRIFFNDQVSFADESQSWAQLLILSWQADAELLEAFSVDEYPEVNQIRRGEFRGKDITSIGLRKQGEFNASLIIFPADETEKLLRTLKDEGQSQISDFEYEQFRIEHGIPGTKEYSASFTPFELGLHDHVSNSKGCYTGQEVLARQVNYDKINNTRVLIHARDEVLSGAKLTMEGQIIGTISSAIAKGANGSSALAIIKRNKAIPGNKVELSSAQKSVTGEIVRVFE